YFVGQYYQVLQQQPEFVHQFYSDASTMLRIDGNTRETATAMLQIHALIMSLNYTGIEIRSAHALESWSAGIIVMVSGSVQLKDFSSRRKFVQTFFLAPQEKGYFLLNDIFQFIDDDPIHHQQAVMLTQNNRDSKRNALTTVPEPVANYLLGGEIHTREFVARDVKESGPADNYGFVEQRLQQVAESESILDENSADQTNGSLPNTLNSLEDQRSLSVEESIGEPQKHTYASILRVAKGHLMPSVASQSSVNKSSPLASDWNHSQESNAQQPAGSLNTIEKSVTEAGDEVGPLDDEGEIKSVYVRNLPPNVSPSEIEEEFKNFGKLKQPEGVVIRSRKEVGVRYAFVEFEDITGVQNAVKAKTVQIAGQPVYIEERRPNSNIPSRVAIGRGRGRGSYQVEASRDRFGARNFGRGGGHDGGDRDYNRPRGNGFYRPTERQDRGNSSHQATGSGAELTS
ncbi:putative G3BP-like protein, partial [Morus notabilis]|uniref:putative G3BP-like protein n=1 Tax=Morus notabilis TaxID=981085 RepID=UPI000CED456A